MSLEGVNIIQQTIIFKRNAMKTQILYQWNKEIVFKGMFS